MWCGVVRCGVMWCGLVRCSVVWCGVVWCGVMWCGLVWCGVVWSGSEILDPLQNDPEFTPWGLDRTSDPERNVMGQSTEMSTLVSMLFRTFLNPLKFIMKIFIFY